MAAGPESVQGGAGEVWVRRACQRQQHRHYAGSTGDADGLDRRNPDLHGGVFLSKPAQVRQRRSVTMLGKRAGREITYPGNGVVKCYLQQRPGQIDGGLGQ